MGDMFDFRLQRADSDEQLEGGDQRWSAVALLDGREFERILIDMRSRRNQSSHPTL